MLLDSTPTTPPPVIIFGDTAIPTATYLRAQNIKTEIAFQSNLKNALKHANRLSAKWAILANLEGLILKNLDDGSQSEVSLESLPSNLTL
jgi:histidyl-tRNA synthetase